MAQLKPGFHGRGLEGMAQGGTVSTENRFHPTVSLALPKLSQFKSVSGRPFRLHFTAPRQAEASMGVNPRDSRQKPSCFVVPICGYSILWMFAGKMGATFLRVLPGGGVRRIQRFTGAMKPRSKQKA
jgi:hypothetical protein